MRRSVSVAAMLERLAWRLKQLWYTATVKVPFLRPKNCSICGFTGLFAPFGYPVRPEAQCPRCLSLERHRLFRLWLNGNEARFAGRKVLHFAPENVVSEMIRPLAAKYVTADIEPGRAELTLNIEDTGLPDASFDCVICSHVLEHVDDAAALAEIKRILAPDGLAVLIVPVIEGWPTTYEDPSITGALDRFLHFGQDDHVRRYGRDFRDRVRQAGFSLSEFTAIEPQAMQHGLLHGETIFLASP